jgi:hypothetical protein
VTSGKLRSLPLALPVVGAITIALSLAILALTGIWRARFVAEAVWYLALLLFFSALQPFRSLMASLPRPYQLTFLAFGLALLSAQFVGGGRHTYPMVRWAMFNDPVVQPKVVLYEGISASGERVLLRPMNLVPSLRNGRFTSKLRQAYQAAVTAPPSDGSTEFDKLLRSLARIRNLSQLNDPIVSVEVFEHTLPPDSWFDRPEQRRTPVWRTAV